MIDGATGDVVVVGADGAQQRIGLALDAALPYGGDGSAGLNLITSGPGPVLYGISSRSAAPVENLAMGTFVAASLADENAGAVVSSVPYSQLSLVEQPSTVLGHGPSGVIHRSSDDQIMPYVDASGATLPQANDAPTYVLDDSGVVRSSSGAAR